jgi:LPS sulfotransferase NodH
VKEARDLAASSAGTRWFVVIGARRTGTNILREILNTNPSIAMLGEVFTPHRAPAHWSNFLAVTGHRFPPANSADATALLDEYFRFVEYRIRNYWQENRKLASKALGLDIKYDQLEQVTPTDRGSTSVPFLLRYFEEHQTILIHTIRKDVIKCAISEIIAQQRNLWHNYDGAVIDTAYYVDPNDCLTRARRITQQRAQFESLSQHCYLIDANYEQLAAAVAGATAGRIAEEAVPLADIARALRVPSRFSYDGRLRRAIDMPYSMLIFNHAELRHALAHSEFAEFALALE